MQQMRLVALIMLAAVTIGSLATSGGFAWYLRSASYRTYCAEYLSEMLELPADIGRVVPRSWNSREFDDVAVWLPERRGRAMFCRRAIVLQTPTPVNADAYDLDLLGGTCEISTRTWLRTDYRGMVESGLRPLFDPAGPRRVTFREMEISFDRAGFQATLENATGAVWFESLELGRAAVQCQSLNGHRAANPVFLNLIFSPQTEEIRIDELELTVPRLPLAILGLQGLAGWNVRSGEFDGRLTYRESYNLRELAATGHCFDLVLAEWTEGLGSRPWRGRAEIELRDLRLRNEMPERLRFAGVLAEVVLGDILEPFCLGDIGGEVTLRVREADLSPNGIDRLIASGYCKGVSLDLLTEALGWGRMTGNLRILIDDLTVESNRLTSLDAKIIVDEATEQPHWVEGTLLSELLSRALHIKLPPFLPERIEYTRFGVRLDVRDEVLHVFGTHGPREKSILTLRIAGQDWPVSEPERAFDLAPSFDLLRARAKERLQGQLRRRAVPGRATAE
ncbi:MAG: hypothetical protein KKB50_06925 [Planctomycetes bacterium]|nr:hypothetical protein [Planctomycetota bacterium]